MSNFDVYINGVQPKYANNIQAIAEQLSQKLQIDSIQAEILLNKTNTRIKKSATKEQADQMQHSLSKLGVICIYKPGENSLGLSLEPIEIVEEDTITACPSCNEKFPDPSAPPEKCDHCDIYIEKYIQNTDQREAKEEIRSQLLLKNSARLAREKKLKEEQEAAIRKKVLEQSVLEENPELIDNNNKKNNKQTGLIMGGTVFIAVAAVSSYLLIGNEEPSSSALASTNNEVVSSQEIEELPTEIPNATTGTGSMSGVDTASAETTNGNITDSQAAIQNTHEQASKVLNAFGLDPDAMANSAGSGGGSTAGTSVMAGGTGPSASSTTTQGISSAGSISEEGTASAATANSNVIDPQADLHNNHEQASKVLNDFGLDLDAMANSAGDDGGSIAGISVTDTSGMAGSTDSSASSATIQGTTASPNKMLTPFIMDFGKSDSGWEHYLAKKAELSISNNNLVVANQIISYLSNTEKYISLSGKVLQNATQITLKSEIDSNIKSKIKSYQPDLQVQYFSQAALIHKDRESTANLLNKADNLWTNISDPKKKLSSALKIAVSHYKAGDTVSANKYFNKIKPLLPKVTSGENPIIARTEISRAFKDVNQNTIAITWLKSTNKMLDSASNSSLEEIINSYAYLDRIDSVEMLAKRASSLENQDKLLYSAIKVSLESGLHQNAIKLVDSIKTPVNKAISLTLLASYIEDNGHYLSSAEAMLNNSIKDPGQKAIVSSKIAQVHSWNKNTSKVDTLIKLTEQEIRKIPSSSERDTLLDMTITNIAHSLNKESAMILLPYVSSPTTQIEINEKINNLSDLFAILKLS